MRQPSNYDECIMCGDPLVEERPRHLRLTDGTHSGPYCSKECVDADKWGPAFRNARIVRMKVKSSCGR